MATQKPPKRKPVPPPAAAGAAATAAGAALATSLTAVFLSGLTGMGLIVACRKVLVAAGVAAAIIGFLALYAFTRLPDRVSPFHAGPAEEEQLRLAAAYRAWYVVNAISRLERASHRGPDAMRKAHERESRWFQWHLRAAANRLDAAADVDRAAERYGLLLGWRAQMDMRTTLECRAANGKNFRADREPVIGWPGAVHPHCRCVPVGPFPGAPLIPSA